MASIFNRNGVNSTNPNVNNKTFRNTTLRKLSGRGYDFKDSVISNSEAIGSIENEIGWQDNNNMLRYGQNDSNMDQLYDFSYSDVYSKKNIPFFDQSYPGKIEQLRRYAMQDEIEMVLDTLTDEIVVYNTDRYFAQVDFESDPNMKEEFSEIIKENLNDNFKKIYNLFGFKNENTAWHFVKKFLIDGYLAYEIIWDNSNTNIIGFKELDPISLTPKIYEDGTRGWVQYPLDAVKKRELSDAQVIFLSYSAINNENRVSYTERLIRSFNLLRIMEQSRIIWAVVNSSYKTKFVIPVGGKSKQMAKQTLGSLMQSYRENVDFDNESGELKINGKAMMPFSKEYWIPEGDQGTPQIENIGNDGPDLSDTESLKYFVDKLISVSKVPRNRFVKEESPTFESSAEGYTREEIYFSRFIDRLRGKIQEILIRPVVLQTKRDIKELADDPLFESKVNLSWARYDIFEKLKETELLQSELDLISTAKDSLIDFDAEGNEVRFFSSEFLVRKFLTTLSESDLKLNRKLKAKEDKEMEQGQEDAEEMDI
tara:strand:- start:25893 stop:27509 length:1617 start_codon:yes stop_codon:yes gene_type:complete